MLSRRLREDGLKLRRMAADGANEKTLLKEKEVMLQGVYRMLALTLGVPPTEFTWTRKDKNGNVVSRKTYTPQEFYKEFAGNDLKNDYVMFMNDPSREYYKVYEIDYDRHTYGRTQLDISEPPHRGYQEDGNREPEKQPDDVFLMGFRQVPKPC